MMVNRPIEAGEQLFDNYGYHHCLENVHDRQISLKNQYMFKCTCEACENLYPLYPSLPRIAKAKDFDLFLGSDVVKLTSLDFDVAMNRFSEYCKYLNLLPYPSFEASSLQECILQCSFIFKATPFKLKLLSP
jgi:SET and MYND domain-containing protein 4